MRVVSNSTPIIALSRIGKLDILRVVFGTIEIPEAVFNEVVKEGASRPGANEVRDAAWIDVQQVAQVWEHMTPEQQEFLRELTAYAVQARYPERKKKLASTCTEQEADRILRFSKEVIAWLKQRLNVESSHRK